MFTFDVSNRNHKTYITIGGELTIYSASVLFNDYVKGLQAEENILVDLSAVEDIDTAGAQILLLLSAEATRQDRTCQFIAVSEAISRYLRLFNLESHFSFANETGEH